MIVLDVMCRCGHPLADHCDRGDVVCSGLVMDGFADAWECGCARFEPADSPLSDGGSPRSAATEAP